MMGWLWMARIVYDENDLNLQYWLAESLSFPVIGSQSFSTTYVYWFYCCFHNSAVMSNLMLV